MVSEKFKTLLVEVYHDEQTGEIALEAMLHAAETAEERYIIGSLMQFETEGKAVIRPILMKYGLPIVDGAECRENGLAASAVNALPWKDRFVAMSDVIATTYLPKYKELASLVSPEEDPEAHKLAVFMTHHEQAFLDSARNIVAGKPDPIAPVVELLNFPLSPPMS